MRHTAFMSLNGYIVVEIFHIIASTLAGCWKCPRNKHKLCNIYIYLQIQNEIKIELLQIKQY